MSAVMVLGCTSSAGKSLLATALCRWYVRQGLRVAPFKAQNMSNNARVVGADRVGAGEIGVAQWLQARAARVVPDVRMNPVLIKPERDGSQVVLLGHVDAGLSALGWTERPLDLWPAIASSLDSLLAEYDLVVAEGAGSPAETNLRDTDLANLRVARHADAPAVLVADIDRGGAFAHLLGTWQLVEAQDRHRLAGFVLNKFRGDPTLLRDAPAELTARTGMAHAGVLPMLAHRLPDEDGARDLTDLGPCGDSAPTVAVVRYPSASNLDELTLLATVTRLRWVDNPAAIADADLVVLPGSKHVHADLKWLRERGLDHALQQRAQRDGRILGICGGLQLLGEHLGPEPVTSAGDRAVGGLGLLSVSTTYSDTKLTAQVALPMRVPSGSPWSRLDDVEVRGYDIRHGATKSLCEEAVLGTEHGWANGPVLGLACHGALESPDLVEALIDTRPVDRLDETLDSLADAVEEHLDTDLFRRLTKGLL